MDQIFNLLVQDLSQFALTQINSFINSEEQEEYLRKMVLTKAVIDPAREKRLWDEHVSILNGVYEMNP